MKNDKNNKWLLIALVITVFVAIVFPIILEKILNYGNFDSSLFNPKDWFAFIASYSGAVSAIILGEIAVWQSKKYNDESNEMGATFLNLQNEISNLIKSNNKVNDSLVLLQRSMFEPKLADAEMMFDCGADIAFLNIDYKHNKHAFAFSNWNDKYSLEHFEDYQDEYHYIAIKLYNDRDKYINTYEIDYIEIDEAAEFDSWHFNTADIAPHNFIWVTVAIADKKFSIIKNRLELGKEVVIRSKFENSLGDKYVSRCRIGYEISDVHNGAYIKGIDIKKECESNIDIEK